MLKGTQPVRGWDESLHSELLHYIMIVSQEYLGSDTSNNNNKSLMQYTQNKQKLLAHSLWMHAFPSSALSSKQGSNY